MLLKPLFSNDVQEQCQVKDGNSYFSSSAVEKDRKEH